MKKAMTVKAEIKVERPNGNIETVDITNKFGAYDKSLFDKIAKSTKDAGKGNVVEMTVTELWNNIDEVFRSYNNLHNEGGEGYTPDKMQATKSEERVVVIK